MKIKINSILKILIISIFFIVCHVNINKVYGYKINIVAATKEQLGGTNDLGEDYPDQVYRKVTGAFPDELTNYNSRAKSPNGWVYNTDPNKTSFTANIVGTAGDTSFIRIYETFHKNQNSDYLISENGTGMQKRYYTSGFLKVNHVPEIKGQLGSSQLYDIYERSTGIGNFSDRDNILSQGVVIYNNNRYRHVVTDDLLYISDNILTSDMIKEIVENVATSKSNETMEVYQSSVLRTGSGNGKNYKYMDTAYKAWATFLYGNKSTDWHYSVSTMGDYVKTGNRGQFLRWYNESPVGHYSFVNYYDNTIEFSAKQNKKEIYVRHIDITNLEKVSSDTITNENVLETQATRAIPYNFGNLDYSEEVHQPTSRKIFIGVSKYSEMYHGLDKKRGQTLRIANIKYEMSNGTKAIGDVLNANEQKIKYGNYTCVGAVVGKGEDLARAVDDRDFKLNIIDIRTTESKVVESKGSTGGIIKGGDYTNCIIGPEDDTSVIVVDFYYEQNPGEIQVNHYNCSNPNFSFENRNNVETKIDMKDISKVLYTVWNDVNTGTDYLKDATYFADSRTAVYNYVNSENPLRIPNIKYDNGTAGSFWKVITDAHLEDKYKNYSCIGVSVGRGNTLEEAKNNLANINVNEFANDLSKLKNKVRGYTSGNANGPAYISKNEDYSSIVIENNDYKYTVVDFYYEKEREKIPGEIYVNHYDCSSSGFSFENRDTVENKLDMKNISKAFYMTLDKIDVAGKYTATPEFLASRTEKYKYDTNSAPLRITNIKYDHNTAGSYWKLITNAGKQNKYKDYSCLGVSVGRGNTLEEATNNLKNINTQALNNDLNKLKNPGYQEFR